MYQVGMRVLYGTEGVCVIDEIREMKISHVPGKYYVLRPINRDGATVFVPLNSEILLAKMRPLLTVEQIEAMLTELRNQKAEWIEDPAERKAAFQQTLRSGDRYALLRMIHALYLQRKSLQEKGKRLRTNDEQLLRDAEKLLNDEFAAVLNIRQHEVPEYIRAHMET